MDSNFFSLLIFCFIAAVTPGPNNFIVLSASILGGAKAALKPFFGITLGFPCMVIVLSYLYSMAEAELLQLAEIIKYIGIAYLLWLSFKIATAPIKSVELEDHRNLPSFWGMFLFQWLNPKAWAIAMAAVTLYKAAYWFTVPGAFWLTSMPAIAIWMFLGRVIRNKILGTSLERYLNIALGLLLAGSVLMLL